VLRKSQISACLKLSNSGDPLKLLILNSICKVYDFLNNLEIVIIQKMRATEMGNRGSKLTTNITNHPSPGSLLRGVQPN